MTASISIGAMSLEYPKYNRIKSVLAEKEKTQAWLVEEMDLSKSAVSKWCQNKSHPNLKTLFEVAKILNCKPCELLGDGE